MSYTSVIKGGAGEAELRKYLVDGDTVSVTMRIPENLRDSAKEAATMRGMSFSAFVRNCLLEELAQEAQR